MNTNLILIVGVGAVAVWALTKPSTANKNAPLNPYQQVPPPAQAPYQGASQNPADLNNYYSQKASDAALAQGIVAGVGSAIAGIFKNSNTSNSGGAMPDDGSGGSYGTPGDTFGSYDPYEAGDF